MPNSNNEAPHWPNRRSVRLAAYRYAQVGGYFVTICTHDRACLFGEIAEGAMRLSVKGETVDDCWRAIPDHFTHVALDALVVMPNHLHGIIVITSDVVGATHCVARPPRGPGRHSLGAIVGSFKSAVSHRLNASVPAGETQASPEAPKVWQRGYYEHVIRGEAGLIRLRRYIERNPGRWEEDEEHPLRFGAGIDAPTQMR